MPVAGLQGFIRVSVQWLGLTDWVSDVTLRVCTRGMTIGGIG